MSEVNLKRKDGKSLPLDKALKILKKKLDKEGVIKDVRRRKFYEKKSVRKYRKNKKAKYIARLISKENELWR